MLQQLLTPLIIPHRGDSTHAPENTLSAFRRALYFRPDMVELDYHPTKDGKLVVVHDFTFDRTTDAVERFGCKDVWVNSLTLPEIKTLDAGSWFHLETGEFAGEQIPTLKEAMDVIQNSSFTLIERKEGKAKDLVRFLKKERWLHEVVVQSFDWDFIKELSEYSNALSLGTLGPPWGKYNGRELTDQDRWLNADFIDDIVSRGAQYIAWNNWVTQESVAFAHEKDLRVLIYTIDDPKEALRLVALGVDGIITNDPETMAKILR